MDPALKTRLDELVHSDQVVLFMKGNRRMPRCGFSATVVGILDGLVDSYTTVDVLADPAIRQGVKDYSDWPTLPQLFIDHEFVGGCDIVREMATSGELHKLIGVELQDVDPPSIEVTEAAAAQLAAASQEAGGDFLRFRVPPNFRYELSLGPKMFGDLEVQAAGITLLVARDSAARADGTVLDFVTGPMGEGFQINNPNEPLPVQQMNSTDLKAALDAGTDLHLVDVRPEDERALAKIDAARPLNAETQRWLAELDKGSKLVFHCHHGGRSQKVAEDFRGQGFTNVHNLKGGIDAWSQEVDSGVARY